MDPAVPSQLSAEPSGGMQGRRLQQALELVTASKFELQAKLRRGCQRDEFVALQQLFLAVEAAESVFAGAVR